MSANLTSSVGESASRTVDLDAQASRWTDGELSARFQSDVIPLREPLYRHAVRLTRNHADAEDLAQETMVKAYAGFRTFEPGGNFAAWLHRILINNYISGYRKQQCRPVQHPTADITDMELAPNTANLASGLRSAEEQALERLGDNRIRAAMEALPKPFRLAVYYADVEGFRCREIADLMRTPVGTVLSRLHRGRFLLRRLLADVAQQRGYIAVAQPA
ncbi:MAG TPA: sigma-70 family RNA polymerase sigma factor [Mycobacterium sp.]|jgi:RNA polymerase sigma-70 factor (ECF subfamily)|nr:sigma-70 family RNA polymerase sigma factor [Mycobacterium sp.]